MTDHRQAVYEANLAVHRAMDARSRAIADALRAGESCRGLAELLGVGAMTVWRWSGLRQRPARTPEPHDKETQP